MSTNDSNKYDNHIELMFVFTKSSETKSSTRSQIHRLLIADVNFLFEMKRLIEKNQKIFYENMFRVSFEIFEIFKKTNEIEIEIDKNKIHFFTLNASTDASDCEDECLRKDLDVSVKTLYLN